ncbi:MAG: hypothetical protein Ct9H300mP9_2950 [Candidatus Neomarinimicrobiota bacterium]|nr:MAG: hypothetical protein Ct9H300mP9_2950 [Candidatus Neomarinimicrobiota bacterium]
MYSYSDTILPLDREGVWTASGPSRDPLDPLLSLNRYLERSHLLVYWRKEIRTPVCIGRDPPEGESSAKLNSVIS